MTENSFAPQNEPHTAILKFFLCFEIFLMILTKLNFYGPKIDYLRKKLLIPQREIFLHKFEKGLILKLGFDLMETTLFVQTREMGQLLLKTVLLHKMSHIQLN